MNILKSKDEAIQKLKVLFIDAKKRKSIPRNQQFIINEFTASGGMNGIMCIDRNKKMIGEISPVYWKASV